ncbi:MAG TPA: TetR/AcrR family transcriptional regulator [Solirubrobacteraceae bacterium]|jgi:AcrR family transcriptional regulator
MAPPTRTPSASWIEEGLRALARGGPDAVRIEPLAKALGVSKGGFYWHFADRTALLDEMLDSWEQSTTEGVVDHVERGGGDGRSKLRHLFALGSHGVVAVDLAVRDWARRDPAVAERLRRIDNRRMEYLRELFSAFCPDRDEVEARAMLFFSLLVGKHFIAADHGSLDRAAVLELTLRELGLGDATEYGLRFDGGGEEELQRDGHIQPPIHR